MNANKITQITPPQSERRVAYYDLLNILACIAVVLLHQNGGVWQYKDSINWDLSVIVETLCYWAVPVFFMLSGATLIGYKDKYSTKIFIRKRLLRTGVPFLFFSIVAFFISYLPDLNEPVTIKEFLIGLMDARFYSLYWFFIPLFWLYFLMPVLTACRLFERIEYLYLTMLLLLICTLPLVNELTSHEFRFSNNQLAGPVLYALLGWYITHHTIGLKTRICIYALALISFLLRGFSLLLLSHIEGHANTLLTNYFYPTTVIQAMAVFLLVQHTNIADKYNNLLKEISSLSLGIYLIHCFIISIEDRLINMSDSYIYIIPVGFLTYFISAIIVYIGKKIPYLKIVFP